MVPSTPPEGQGEPRAGRARPALVVEDFRSVRRWLVIIGVLAVIATGLAAYAVIRASGSAESDQVTALEKRLTALDRKSSEESDVDKLQRELRKTSEESDVVAINRRLNRLERDVVDAVDASAKAGKGNERLQERFSRISVRVDRLRRKR
jgi:hypothetical protein